MSLRSPVCIRHGPRWLSDSSHPRSELKRRFFACFPSSPGPRSAQAVPSRRPSPQAAAQPGNSDGHVTRVRSSGIVFPQPRLNASTQEQGILRQPTDIHHGRAGDHFPKWSSEQFERYDGSLVKRSRQALDLEESVVKHAGWIRSWKLSTDFEKYKRLRDRLYFALTRPCDNPDFQHVKKMGRPPPRSWDPHYQQFGESAYDWRPTLELLMDKTKPASEEEVKRLREALHTLPHLHTSVQRPEERMAHAFIHNQRAPYPELQDAYPAVKTPQSFAQYIFNVASTNTPLPEVPAKIHRKLSGTRANIRRDAIRQAMYDPQNRSLLTYQAFHTAIHFFQVTSEIMQARELLEYMSKVGLEPTIDIYNNMFHSMALRKNLSAFTALLTQIVRKGIHPDAVTWCEFVRCLDSRVVQDIVIKEMRKLALFSYPNAPSIVALSLLRQDIGDFLREGESVWQFLKNQESQWDNDWRWLTTRVTDDLLVELAYEGRVHELASILAMRAYAGNTRNKPTAYTLIRLLQVCTSFGQPQGAVDIVWFFHSIGIEPNRVALELLFKVFLLNGYANCCRVIWQIACIQGLAFHKIKIQLTRTLMTPPHCVAEPLKDRLSIFQAYASKVIAGRGIAHNWKMYWDDWLYYDEPERRENMMYNVQSVLLQSDKDVHAPMVFTGSVAEELKRAFEQDLEWQRRPEVLGGDIDWMMANAYNVQFVQSSEQAKRAQRAKAMEAILAYEEQRKKRSLS